MSNLAEGGLEKMRSQLKSPVEYTLLVGDQNIPLNTLLGKKIRFQYLGLIKCIYCQRPTKKSFNQGYCYPCFQRLARCDSCIVSPEKCHYALGTCREPAWALDHCMIEHVVYLSNTSGPKVGITRASQVPTRWIDQGAVQALPLMSVKSRQQSGLIEQIFKAHVADKTSWQTMLKGGVVDQDLLILRNKLLLLVHRELNRLQDSFASSAVTILDQAAVVNIHYPVERYPEKIKSLDFEKQPLVEGILQGIKGQYLLLDTGVINVRKFTAYQVGFSVH